jgi:hypothetical protein
MGMTLEEIGELLGLMGLMREKVRQIENLIKIAGDVFHLKIRNDLVLHPPPSMS